MNYGRLNIYDNSKDVLTHVMHVYGADVLLGSTLKSFFDDYAPSVETLRKNVIFSVSSSGAADILKRNMAADDMGHENAFRQAVQRVIDTYGTERGLVESVVREFTEVLGWNAKITQTSNTVVGTQHAEMRNEKTFSLKIGQRGVKFGRYNWRVLDVQNDKALLLAEDVIEQRPYHVYGANVTWETCSLRGYLNGEFLKTFSDSERSRIVESGVRNENNPEYGTNGGSGTRDKVFLLSIKEVNRYLRGSGNGERAVKYKGEKAWWWLRSPGDNGNSAAGVNEYGDAYLNGSNVGFGNGGVRPALWINVIGSDVDEVTVTKSQQVQMQQTHTQNVPRHTQTSAFQIGQRNVKFGRYSWRVLDVQNDKALLLAEDVVGLGPYHVTYEDVTWETCTLRGYLNGEFFKTFSDAERNRIALTAVRNKNNQWYGINGGSDTSDRVFLLSIEEVVRYFGDSGALARKTGNGIRYYGFNSDKMNPGFIETNEISRALFFNDQYSPKRVAKCNKQDVWWWLRSPGNYSNSAAGVLNDGAVFLCGSTVNTENGCVRPALWINP